MKRFPRLLPLFSMLLFAFAWPGSSEVSVATSGGATSREWLAPPSPEILSFTITPAVIHKGQEITLRWRVSDAAHIWLSTPQSRPSPDMTVCIDRLSGELRFSPDRDVIYELNVWGQGVHVLKEATVQVDDAGGFCTISGGISNDSRDNGTRVNLYRLNSLTPVSSTTPDSSGQYSFTGVRAGIYRVVPSGRYRPGVGAFPRSKKVECWPNETHPANFRIGSSEG